MKIELYNIPNVDKYVNQMIAQFLKHSSELSEGDILVADRIDRLREKSLYMLKNIDNFMNKNCLDARVKYLYATRNKLFKFLQKIKENKFVSQVNHIKENQNLSSRSITDYRKLATTSDKQNLVVGEKSDRINENPSRQLSSIKKNSNRFEPVKNLQQINQFTTQQEKQTPRNKNTLRLEKSKKQKRSQAPYTQKKFQETKKDGQWSYSKLKTTSNQKQKTPVKTSRKTELCTPKKISNAKPRQEQSKLSYQQDQPVQRKRSPQFIESSTKKTKITPQKRAVPSLPISSTEKKYTAQSEFKHGNLESKRMIAKQEQSSSAIKNLANLIFTIKMTREQYNQFKRIQIQQEKEHLLSLQNQK